MNGKELWREAEKYVNIDKNELVLPSFLVGEMQDDFKWFLFSLSRYKFAGKILEGKERVLEVGCSYGFKTRMLSQFVDCVVGVDFDEDAVNFADLHYKTEKREYICADILNMKTLPQFFDGLVCLDVIEHIAREMEPVFMENILRNLSEHSVCIMGTPNITAAQYQSEGSRVGHINLYSHDRLKEMMSQYFYHVFMFSMNDEVVHTGFAPMAHYLFAVGVDKRKQGCESGRVEECLS